MKGVGLFLLFVVPAALSSHRASGQPPDSGSSASIERITLPRESEEHIPVAVPTEPENTVELDFPWPLEDWAGRGFTPDAEKYAGDFVIEANRGKQRVFVTPVSAGAHRVLHVVLSLPGGKSRGIPVEFVPAPAGLAWRKVVFLGDTPVPEKGPAVALSPQPPRTRYREPSPASELGLLTTLRLMLSSTAEGARARAAADPSLERSLLGAVPRSFGDFTITPRFALRDATTDALGLCASVANTTPRRLIVDPASWVVRAGDRVYPVGTVDFPAEIEPGSTAPVFLVVARAPNGAPNLLLPDNRFEISAVLLGSVNPRPVLRMPLPGFETQ